MEETPDRSERTERWLRLADAAALAKVSEKTIRNWAEARRIGRRKEKGIVYYSSRDIEEMAEKSTELALVRENNKNGPPVLATLLAAATAQAQAQAQKPEPLQIEGKVEEARNGIVPLQHWELWLTYERAHAYSGLGLYRLQELVLLKKIRTEKGRHGAVVLSKQDLDAGDW